MSMDLDALFILVYLLKEDVGETLEKRSDSGRRFVYGDPLQNLYHRIDDLHETRMNLPDDHGKEYYERLLDTFISLRNEYKQLK